MNGRKLLSWMTYYNMAKFAIASIGNRRRSAMGPQRGQLAKRRFRLQLIMALGVGDIGRYMEKRKEMGALLRNPKVTDAIRIGKR